MNRLLAVDPNLHDGGPLQRFSELQAGSGLYARILAPLMGVNAAQLEKHLVGGVRRFGLANPILAAKEDFEVNSDRIHMIFCAQIFNVHVESSSARLPDLSAVVPQPGACPPAAHWMVFLACMGTVRGGSAVFRQKRI